MTKPLPDKFLRLIHLMNKEDIVGLDQYEIARMLDLAYTKHTDGPSCWCKPKLVYFDRLTKVETWGHRHPTKH